MSVPYAPEVVADWLGWTPAAVRERFGEVVLVNATRDAIELRPFLSPAEQMRARVAAIIEAARPRVEA